MAEKVITYKVKVNVDGVEKTVKKAANTMDNINEATAKYTKMLGEAEVGSKRFDVIKGRLQKLKDAQEKATIASMSFGDAMSSIPGPVGQVSQGVQGLGKTLKVLAANPIIAVITVLVGAVIALYKAFTSTKEGAEKMERVFAGLSAAMDVIRDKVLELFTSWDSFTKIFTVDFWKETGKEIANEAKAAAELTGQLQKLEDQQRNLNVSRSEQNKLIAEAKSKINDETLSYEERKEALEEVLKTEENQLAAELALEKQRLAAMEALAAMSDSSAEDLEKIAQQQIKINQLEEQSINKQKEIADQRKALNDREKAERKARYEEYKRQQQEAFNFEQSLDLELIQDKNERAERQLEIERDNRLKEIKDLRVSAEKKKELRLKVEQDYQNDLAAQRETARIEQENQTKADLDKAKADREADRQARIKEIDTEVAIEQLKEEQNIQVLIDALDKKTKILLENEELTANERELIQAQYTDQVKKLQDGVTANLEANKRKEIELEYQKAAASANALGLIADAAGKETLVGQAAAVAQANINTYLAASQVIADETLPTFLKPIAVAAIIASGLKQVQEIMSVNTEVPKYSMGGYITGPGTDTSDSITAQLSPGEAVINAQSVRAFAPLLSKINQAGGGAPIIPPTASGMIGESMGSPLVKAYVVSKDMTTQQQFDRNVKSRSMI